jgi:hypothetical protein
MAALFPTIGFRIIPEALTPTDDPPESVSKRLSNEDLQQDAIRAEKQLKSSNLL